MELKVHGKMLQKQKKMILPVEVVEDVQAVHQLSVQDCLLDHPFLPNLEVAAPNL